MKVLKYFIVVVSILLNLFFFFSYKIDSTGRDVASASCIQEMSRLMGKPTICIGENKGADQLRGNREADQRLCFRNTDSTLHLLLQSKISSF